METRSRKRLKKSSEADDRISKLPDEVLLHILSFIPTFESIATSMLSSRWKHLWKHVPALDFDCEKYSNKNFVNKVRTLHVSKVLQKLSFTCCNDDIYDVGKWVSDSITRNIHSLYLTISHVRIGHVVQLPSSLFTCKTLEVLVLKGGRKLIIVNVPTVVCLPKLKKLKLVGVMCHNDQRECTGRFISSCSSLERLVIKGQLLQNDYVGFHTISSSTLRDVKLRLCEPSLMGYNPEIFCSALRRLNLSFGYRFSGKVPTNVFTCKTLEELILSGGFVICASRTIYLPKLKFLALVRVRFEDDEFSSTLISSCTSLESLTVTLLIKVELSISSCTLKNTEIDLSYHSGPARKLVINAPALQCLQLRNGGHVDYQIGDLASLERADVNFGSSWYSDSDYCSRFLIKAFQALGHVKSLKIFQGFFNVGAFERGLPMFNRLTELDLTVNNWRGYSLFRVLVTNSIKLESLAFELDVEASPDHSWRNLDSVPTCLLSSLRSVSIRNFKGREDELAMALYLLEHARIMEKMEVHFLGHSNDMERDMERELCNIILNARRGSEICNVVFSK